LLLFQAGAHGLQVGGQVIWIDIEFAGARQGFFHDLFQFRHFDKVVLDEKDDVVKVCIEAALQFTKGDGVRIGYIYFKVSEFIDKNCAVIASRRQGDESLQGNRFGVNTGFFCNLHDGKSQRSRGDIVADKIKINCQARASQQRQRSAADQGQTRRGGMRSPMVFKMDWIWALSIFSGISVLQSLEPDVCSVLVGSQPVNFFAA
jgi:hypothetical protein